MGERAGNQNPDRSGSLSQFLRRWWDETCRIADEMLETVWPTR